MARHQGSLFHSYLQLAGGSASSRDAWLPVSLLDHRLCVWPSWAVAAWATDLDVTTGALSIAGSGGVFSCWSGLGLRGPHQPCQEDSPIPLCYSQLRCVAGAQLHAESHA